MKLNCLTFLLLLFTVTCTPQKENTEQAGETIETEMAAEPEVAVPSAADSAWAQSLIDGLSIIEQYAVGENYYMLASLLRHKGDSMNYKKVKTMVGSPDDVVYESNIDILDAKNGFIRYSPIGTEATYTSVYWRLPNGGRLYGTTELSCGPVCSCQIFFTRFESGTYTRMNRDDIMPPEKEMMAKLYPEFENEQDPLEFIYNLPQKGKNITFCLQDCLELVWKDGTFELKK